MTTQHVLFFSKATYSYWSFLNVYITDILLRHDYVGYKTHKDMISKTIGILSNKSTIMFYETKISTKVDGDSPSHLSWTGWLIFQRWTTVHSRLWRHIYWFKLKHGRMKGSPRINNFIKYIMTIMKGSTYKLWVLETGKNGNHCNGITSLNLSQSKFRTTVKQTRKPYKSRDF